VLWGLPVVEALLIEKKAFDEMVKFVMKAVRDGVPEDEVWATLEFMSSKELQADVTKSFKEIGEGKVMRFRNARKALEWLSGISFSEYLRRHKRI